VPFCLLVSPKNEKAVPISWKDRGIEELLRSMEANFVSDKPQKLGKWKPVVVLLFELFFFGGNILWSRDSIMQAGIGSLRASPQPIKASLWRIGYCIGQLCQLQSKLPTSGII